MSNVIDKHSLEMLSDAIDEKAEELVNRHRGGLIGEEEDYTQLVIVALAEVINGFKLDLTFAPSPSRASSSASQIALHADHFDGRPTKHNFDGRPMKRKGRGSEESKTGADMMLLFSADGIHGLATQKGLLAQAKKRDTKFRVVKDEKLFYQCQQMAEISGNSFALVYALNGILVFKDAHEKSELKFAEADYTLGSFISEFIRCEIGNEGLVDLTVGGFIRNATQLKERRLKEIASDSETNSLLISAEVF